jgi:type IV secretion system protein VirB3
MNSPSEPAGLTTDVLFVAATRPSTRWGVPYLALLVNAMVTLEMFLLLRNPLFLLMALPLHGLCWLLCARDVRRFELALLWGQTRLLGYGANLTSWRSNTYSPLILDVPNARGRRHQTPTVIL